MLKISRQAVHQYQRRSVSAQAHVEDILSGVRGIRVVMPRVGCRKMMHHLPDLGMGRDKFFDILRQHGLLVRRRCRYIITTRSDHPLPVFPNLMPQTAVDAPNQVWVADQTYIRLLRGFCYLSLLTDLWSHRIVGYAVSPTLEASGPLQALRRALAAERYPMGLIHHSDRGKQYCSDEYVQTLKEHGCRISMTAPRRPDQNAVAERVNGILKTEFYLDATFRTIEEARRAIVQAIYIYNNIRLHTSLGMVTPSFRHAV